VVTLTAGGQTIQVVTPAGLARVLPRLLEANPPGAVAGGRELLAHVEALTDRVVAGDPTVVGAQPLLRAVAAFVQPAVPSAAQGIVVGGRVAEEVRILSNTITGAVQGIHVGVSHRGLGTPPDQAGRVTIAGNTVDVVLPAAPVGERHAIFVGNCDRLLIHDNFAVVSQSVQARLPIDGVRVHGLLGRRVIVDQNHLVNFTTGVFVRALNSPFGGPTVLWLVADNFAPASNPLIDAQVAVRSPTPPPRSRLVPDNRWAKRNNVA
jgi:hypothetical protein